MRLLQLPKQFCHLRTSRSSSKLPWCLLSFFSYSYSDNPHMKAKATPLQETRMRDRCTLYAKGGDGGHGCSSIRRSRHDCRGRSDGGDGGRGGDVILECSPAVWDFSGLQPHVKAAKGGHGASKNMIGTRGEDKIVRVPVGTVIHLLRGEPPSMVETCSKTNMDPWDLPGTLDANQLVCESKSVSENPSMEVELESSDSSCSLATDGGGSMEESVSAQDSQDESEGADTVKYNVVELTQAGQQVTIARGGEGGVGSVSSSKRANLNRPGSSQGNGSDPEIENDNELSPEAGLPGSEAMLVLELKTIADVGLVGMPNAGKSTLLGAMSRAKPKVGHYAFTTLRPNLGKVNFDDLSITVADIPGLIKGAHENRGLGHAFLRHIERTKVLAYIIDLAVSLGGRKGMPPWEQLRDLLLELEHHQEGLSARPSLVVANKIDEAGAEDMFEEFKRRVKGIPIYPVCAVLEEGVPELKAGLKMLVHSGNLQRLSLSQIDCS